MTNNANWQNRAVLTLGIVESFQSFPCSEFRRKFFCIPPRWDCVKCDNCSNGKETWLLLLLHLLFSTGRDENVLRGAEQCPERSSPGKPNPEAMSQSSTFRARWKLEDANTTEAQMSRRRERTILYKRSCLNPMKYLIRERTRGIMQEKKRRKETQIFIFATFSPESRIFSDTYDCAHTLSP